MKLLSLFSLLLLLTAGLEISHSQVLINSTNWSYEQNFNSLPGTNIDDPVATWTNNSTLTGWYGFGHYLAATTRMVASIGDQANIVTYGGNQVNTLQNIGSGSDRALGLWATGTAGNNYILFSMQNTSETTIDNMSISYDALKVDVNATPPGKPALMLSYQISPTPFNISGSWTSIPEAEYNPGGNFNLTPFSLNLTNLNLEDGQYLTLRFHQLFTSVPAGIDNFRIQAIPEPQTFLLAAFGILLWISRRNLRRVSHS